MEESIVMGSHVFYKTSNLFVPIDNTCMFCGKDSSDSGDSDLFFSLFKEQDRTNLVVYRNVKFSRINIGISRCSKCEAIQKGINKHSSIIGFSVGIGITVIFVLIGLLLAKSYNLSMILPFLAAIPGGLLGIFFGSLIYGQKQKKMSISNHILTERDAAMKYSLVQSLLKEGWTFEQPTA